MKNLYDQVSRECSKITTLSYSTSFSLGIRCLDKSIHYPIYSIYGFVRFADEIVDTFFDYPQEKLLDKFEQDTYAALDEKISLNPILNSFQEVVHQFNIRKEWIDTFLKSMRMDLAKVEYNQSQYEEYILGSAEVVGLMCLHVFTNGNENLFNELKPAAMKLGSAFQKVNFLRDIQMDSQVLGRMYFPNVNFSTMTEAEKKVIENDIQEEYNVALKGIKNLPKVAQFGVYLAYRYYQALLDKIVKVPVKDLLSSRIRISNFMKTRILIQSYTNYKLGIW